MMETPICDFVKAYGDSASLRLHMPGHKGNGLLGVEKRDITEIDGADVLYHARGIIRRSEENAAALFGTARTVYSAEGSSLSIRAMLYLAKVYGTAQGRPPHILAGRNAHKSLMTAAALLDLDIHWLYPEQGDTLLSCNITGEMLDAALSNVPELPLGVYITAPDYLGNEADIGELSRVCRRYGVLLLVDNAHGAYLHFLPQSRHPMALGADMCCDSAHKTLPVLTGGGYLHISKEAPSWFGEQAENALSLFASTSPSYLILQSLDLANRYLAEGYRERLATFALQVDALKERLRDKGYTLIGSEPLKITIAPKSYGYTGQALAQQLAEHAVVCEFADPDYLVMMLTPENGEQALIQIEGVLGAIPQKQAILSSPPPLPHPVKRLSPREALFSPGEEVPLDCCLGKVSACAAVSCPPAVPLAVCGEVIDEDVIALMEYYGIHTCRVVGE